MDADMKASRESEKSRRRSFEQSPGAKSFVESRDADGLMKRALRTRREQIAGAIDRDADGRTRKSSETASGRPGIVLCV